MKIENFLKRQDLTLSQKREVVETIVDECMVNDGWDFEKSIRFIAALNRVPKRLVEIIYFGKRDDLLSKDVLVKIIGEFFGLGCYLTAIIDYLAVTFDIPKDHLKNVLNKTKFSGSNPVVGLMPTPDKNGNHEMKNTLYTLAFQHAINKVIFGMLEQNKDLTVISATIAVLNYFDVNISDESIGHVAKAIRQGMTNNPHFSGKYREELTRDSYKNCKGNVDFVTRNEFEKLSK